MTTKKTLNTKPRNTKTPKIPNPKDPKPEHMFLRLPALEPIFAAQRRGKICPAKFSSAGYANLRATV